ncbi:MAG: Gfo/Idh/MocA family oxidoreductase [Anaerolineaceae bacterium]|nr:Gfo/Idh/MocA family oxidoreductase [Anaerolineaceae bacterium]
MRVGILSFAHLHAEGYVSNLWAIPDVELIGFADDNPVRGKYFAEKFNLRQFESYEALLTEQPDAVIICSENARHYPLVKLAAEAGAHVLCEKPLATTLEDAQAIIDVCQANGVQLMTAFPMRFSPSVIEVKKLVDSGGLGPIYGCNSTNQGALPRFHQAEGMPDLGRDWFINQQLAGGGAVADHVVHLTDLLRWILQSEVVEVYAQTNQIFHRDEVEVETGGVVMLTFANGTFASIDCSWSKPAYYPTWGGLKLELVGESGLAAVDAFKQTMTLYNHDLRRPVWLPWGSDANQGMVAEFLDAARANRTPAITGLDGYQAVAVVAAAYQSAMTGGPVTLNGTTPPVEVS